MKALTLRNTWTSDLDYGWGNGYVVIPPSSTWHGVDHSQFPVKTPCGLSWSSTAKELKSINGGSMPPHVKDDDWLVGFSTRGAIYRTLDERDVERCTYRLLGAIELLDTVPYSHSEPLVSIRCPRCQSLNQVNHLVDDCSSSPELKLMNCHDCKESFYFSM